MKLAEGHDVVPCLAEGRHLSTRRHSHTTCPAEHPEPDET